MGHIFPSHNPLTEFGFATELLCKWLCWSTSLVPSPTVLQDQGSGFFHLHPSLQSHFWELSPWLLSLAAAGSAQHSVVILPLMLFISCQEEMI